MQFTPPLPRGSKGGVRGRRRAMGTAERAQQGMSRGISGAPPSYKVVVLVLATSRSLGFLGALQRSLPHSACLEVLHAEVRMEWAHNCGNFHHSITVASWFPHSRTAWRLLAASAARKRASLSSGVSCNRAHRPECSSSLCNPGKHGHKRASILSKGCAMAKKYFFSKLEEGNICLTLLLPSLERSFSFYP